MANKEVKLKPCPFCGGKSNLWKNYVACSVCGIRQPDTSGFLSDEELTERWNNRHPAPLPPGILPESKMIDVDLGSGIDGDNGTIPSKKPAPLEGLDEEKVYECLTLTLGVRDTTDGDRRKFAKAICQAHLEGKKNG
jgi:hypothetical protein